MSSWRGWAAQQRGRAQRRTNEANAHLRSACHLAELGRMRGHTKPSGHAAHSKRRSPTEILHARMPPDAREAGHGTKSDTHANCGNYEKYGKSRLRASAPWTVNRLRAMTGQLRVRPWRTLIFQPVVHRTDVNDMAHNQSVYPAVGRISSIALQTWSLGPSARGGAFCEDCILRTL